MQKQTILSTRLRILLTTLGVLVLLILVEGVCAAWGTWRVWSLAVLFLLCGLVLVWAYFKLWKPYRDTSQKLAFYAAKGTKDYLEQIQYCFNRPQEQALKRVLEHMATSTTLELSKRQAQYQALQNQINPHFLYNTLESIRSEALMSGLQSVAAMCEALASFFRYTISNMENLVTVEQEVENIKTYFYIQQYRFGDRLKLEILCPQEDQDIIMKSLLPKLTFQPIVENAIIHGIEQKVGQGTVTIHMVLTGTRVLIRIADNGVGMAPETLHKINANITTEQSSAGKSQGGIAIGNVNKRIKLLFGEDYGLTVFSTIGVGTDVEITLPRVTEQEKNVLRKRTEGLK